LRKNDLSIDLCEVKGRQEDMIFGKEPQKLNEYKSHENIIIKNYTKELDELSQDLYQLEESADKSFNENKIKK
jgi:hypothetical protein